MLHFFFVCKHPIAFSKELEHTKQYLTIEELQYGGKLKVKFQINAENFLIPALTLQPIVENAVKHGVSKRYECGTVLIRADLLIGISTYMKSPASIRAGLSASLYCTVTFSSDRCFSASTRKT